MKTPRYARAIPVSADVAGASTGTVTEAIATSAWIANVTARGKTTPEPVFSTAVLVRGIKRRSIYN
jgi:hypothetical protein